MMKSIFLNQLKYLRVTTCYMIQMTFASVSLLVQPVMAALWAWLLLAEPLGPVQALGAAVVLAGIWIARRGSVRS